MKRYSKHAQEATGNLLLLSRICVWKIRLCQIYDNKLRLNMISWKEPSFKPCQSCGQREAPSSSFANVCSSYRVCVTMLPFYFPNFSFLYFCNIFFPPIGKTGIFAVMFIDPYACLEQRIESKLAVMQQKSQLSVLGHSSLCFSSIPSVWWVTSLDLVRCSAGYHEVK